MDCQVFNLAASVAGEAQDADSKHPASELYYQTPSRIRFMDALTAPLFGNKTRPPFRFVRIEYVEDFPDAGKRKAEPLLYPQIVCEIPRGRGENNECHVLTLTIDEIYNAAKPPAWAATFTQETLTRPWHQSMHFWGSVRRFRIADMPFINVGYLECAVSWMSGFCTPMCAMRYTDIIDTVDLLLTVLIEANWVPTRNPRWHLSCSFPHLWVAHSAKFNVGDLQPYPHPMMQQFVSLDLARFQPTFFDVVRRLLRKFDLDALPIRSIELDYKTRTPEHPRCFDFEGVFANSDKVTVDVDTDAWEYFGPMLSRNFPKLTCLVFDAPFPPKKLDMRIPRFLSEHKNTVTLAQRRGPDDGVIAVANINKYVSNTKAMRTLTEADASSLAAAAKPPPIVYGFFRSQLFEPFVVRTVGRFLNGRIPPRFPARRQD